MCVSVSKETKLHGNTDLVRQRQKRPIYMAKQIYSDSVKKDLAIWQNRPSKAVSKETDLYAKTDLGRQCQKRPSHMAKQT